MRPISPSNATSEGRAAFSMTTSDHVIALRLTAGAAKVIDIPPKAAHVAFSANVDFLAKLGDAPEVTAPVEDQMDGMAGELNPSMRVIGSHTKIAIVSLDDGIATLSFYGL